MNEEEKRKSLGLKIQKLRKSKDLTQEAFCEAIGLEASNLSKIENGKYFPSLPTFIKMAEAFKIEPSDLLDVEHLKDDEKLEEEMIAIIKRQSTEKKQLLYRLIKMFNE